MPGVAFVIGGAVVLSVWFSVGRALRPEKPVPVERWMTSRVPDHPAEAPSAPLDFYDRDGDFGISPGSVRGMIEYMRRSETEIAMQRLALERDDWNIAPAFKPEAGPLPIDLREKR